MSKQLYLAIVILVLVSSTTFSTIEARRLSDLGTRKTGYGHLNVQVSRILSRVLTVKDHVRSHVEAKQYSGPSPGVGH